MNKSDTILPLRTIKFMDGYWNVDHPIKEFCAKMELELIKVEKELEEAKETLLKIEEIYIDGEDTYEDWKKMGTIAKSYCDTLNDE